MAFTFANMHLLLAQSSGTAIVNGGSGQGLLTNVPGMDCTSCQYITKTTSGFWRMKILPVRVSPWSQDFLVDIQYGIDKPSKIRGLNAQGGETIYDISEFVNKLDRVSIDFEIVSEMTTPGNGSKETYVTTFKADKYGEHTVKTSLLTFRATPLLDSLYRISSKYQGDINPSDFQSKFNFRVVSITAKSGSAFGYTLIDTELGRKLDKAKTDSEFQRLVQEGKNFETQGNIDNAIIRYEEALAIKSDSQVRQNVSSLKQRKDSSTATSSSNLPQSGTSSSSDSTQTTKGSESSNTIAKSTTNNGNSETPAQANLRRERERQARIDANAEALAIGAVAVASILSEVLPEPSFGIGDVGLSLSGNNQYYGFQVGFGYRLTPEDVFPTAAMGIGYIAGIMVSDVNWNITLQKSRTHYNDPVEYYSETFDKLKPAVFMGLGGNFFIDSPWKNKAFHLSGFWGAGGIYYSDSVNRDDLLSRSNRDDKQELVLITNVKAEIINFFNDSNGISLGIGYEKNIFNYHDGIGGGTIRKSGFLMHLGFIWM